MKRATVLDVARVAGVAVGTVSRVLNDHPQVRQEKRDRVLSAIKALGFQRNAVARSMRRHETQVIGCMITDIMHPLVVGMVSAAEKKLRASGYATVIASSGEKPEQELQLLDFFVQRRVDGLIAHVTRQNHRGVVRALRQLNIPVVLFERRIGREFDSVVMDHGGACYEATKHLLRLGHQRIGVITGAAESWPGLTRKAMHARALREAGLEPDPRRIRGINSSVAEGYEACQALLTAAVPPTALIAGANEMAGVLKSVRHLGLHVPGDVSLVTLGDSDLTELASPPMTTVAWRLAESGDLIADLMLQRLRNPTEAGRSQIVLPGRLITRESCAPPPPGRHVHPPELRPGNGGASSRRSSPATRSTASLPPLKHKPRRPSEKRGRSVNRPA